MGDPLTPEPRRQLDALVEKLAAAIPAKDARRLVGQVIRHIMQEVRQRHVQPRGVVAGGASHGRLV